MSADDVKSAVERLTQLAEFAEGMAELSKGQPISGEHAKAAIQYRTILAHLDQLTEENERLREAIGLSSADIFDDLMDLYADPHINRLTYAAAKAIVIAEDRATKAEAERDEALTATKVAAAYALGTLDSIIHHSGDVTEVAEATRAEKMLRALLARSAQGGETAALAQTGEA